MTQIGEPPLDPPQVFVDHRGDVPTRNFASVAHCKDRPQLGEGEPRGLRVADEAQPPDRLLGVVPVPAWRARRGGNEAAVFVETDRLGGQSRRLRQRSDLHPNSVCLDLPPYWKVYVRAVPKPPPTATTITVLSVPDCPNASLLIERLRRLRLEPRTEVVVVRDEDQAAAWGMCGSPTLLVDGVDPFVVEGTRPSLSCRLYFAPDGRPAGVPSVEQLRAAMSERISRGGETRAWLDTVGRGGRGRLAPVAGGMRSVQQAVLRALASSAAMPDEHVLDAAAGAEQSGNTVLAALAEQDFVSLDEDGVRGAYPFSLRPTRHRVAIDGRPAVWAMCAIDALGVTPMLGRPTTVTSPDPVSGQPITVRLTPTTAHWEPAGAVVFAGSRAGSGPAASTCCDAINFFASAHSAARWAVLHPEVRGTVLDPVEAIDIGRAIFGGLLDRD